MHTHSVFERHTHDSELCSHSSEFRKINSFGRKWSRCSILQLLNVKLNFKRFFPQTGTNSTSFVRMKHHNAPLRLQRPPDNEKGTRNFLSSIWATILLTIVHYWKLRQTSFEWTSHPLQKPQVPRTFVISPVHTNDWLQFTVPRCI